VNPLVNMYERNDAKVAEFLERGAGNGSGYAVVPRLDALAAALGDGPFFGGDQPSYGDFNAFHYVDNLDTLVPGILGDRAGLVAWMVRVSRLPGVSTYLASRPPLGTTSLGFPKAPIQTPAGHRKPWDVDVDVTGVN